MAKRNHTEHASAEQIDAIRDRGELRSDWAAAEAMTRAEIERLANEDDGPLPEGWESTVELGIPARRQAVNIRLDAEVLA